MTTKVGIAGLGTVGGALLEMIVKDERFSRSGADLQISGVSARTRNRPRPVPIEEYRWFDDPVALATDPETEVFVELMGGAEGPAREAVEAALKAGKSVVTANKALVAAHGTALAQMAEASGAQLKFEAAVAGGTPVVRAFHTSLAPCQINSICGILNGTCNFVLDQMSVHGAAYDDAVKDAQEAGFAEADPSLDVDGIDAAQKLAILTTLAFDGTVPPELIAGPNDLVEVTGISGVTTDDIEFARRAGCAIKLVGQARRAGDEVMLRVAPMFVPVTHTFAKAEGAGNAVRVEADPLGTLLFTGPGAGAGATASAAAADLAALARGDRGRVFSCAAEELKPLRIRNSGEEARPHAMRLAAIDGAADKAAIAVALSEAGCPPSRIDLHNGEVDVITPLTDEATLQKACASLETRGLARVVSLYALFDH